MSVSREKFKPVNTDRVPSSAITCLAVVAMTIALGVNFFVSEGERREQVLHKDVDPKTLPENSITASVIPINSRVSEQLEARIAQDKHQDMIEWANTSPQQRDLKSELALVTPAVMEAWDKVHDCEGNDWNSDGQKFPGGLGIMRENWDYYGRGNFGPAHSASPKEQVVVARRVQHENGVYSVPDQDGTCSGW